MLLFAAAALVAGAPPNHRATPVVAETSATVRIVSGVRLKLDSPINADAPPARDSKVTAEGKAQPARLIEFE